MKLKNLFFLLIAGLSAMTALAQSKADLTGTWVVTVAGEARTRTLIVSAEAPTPDGALLQAKYGMSDESQGAISAEMKKAADGRQLVLTTQANTKIIATEQPDGRFTGTFTLKTGAVKDVSIARLGEGQVLATAKPAASNAAVPPSSDVPPDCAAYYGNWLGRWSQGSAGEVYLRIAEVRSTGGSCSVRYSYSSSPTTTPGKKTAEIKDGTLVFVCNSSTGGTCVFERKSDSLWASYSNPIGGGNNGVFKRIE